VEELDITVAGLDNQMGWDYWEEDDVDGPQDTVRMNQCVGSSHNYNISHNINTTTHAPPVPQPVTTPTSRSTLLPLQSFPHWTVMPTKPPQLSLIHWTYMFISRHALSWTNLCGLPFPPLSLQ
jgi:hypothetical protein